MTKSHEITVTREDAKTTIVEILKECEKLRGEFGLASESPEAQKEQISNEYQRQIFRLLSLAKEEPDISRELNKLDALYQAEWLHKTGLLDDYFALRELNPELEQKFPRILSLAPDNPAASVLSHFFNSVCYDNTGKVELSCILRPQKAVIGEILDKHIVLKNITCVDADNTVFEKYDKLLVPKDIFRDPLGAQMNFTPYNAAVYCEQNGLFLPSFALSCNIAAASFQNRKDAEINKLLLQYKDHGDGYGWQGQNNVINYGTEEVIHYPSAADFGQAKAVNAGCQRRALKFAKATLHDCLLEEALRDMAHTRFVRQLTGLHDLSVLVEIGKYFSKPARLWFPWNGQTGANYNEKRAAWFGCGNVSFSLSSSCDLGSSDATRGVRCEP